MKGTTNQQQSSDPDSISVSADGQPMASQPTRLDKIFHDIPGAVIVTDRDGHIHNMNQAARALLGEPDGNLQLGEWPRAFGLYTPDGAQFFPAAELPPARALLGLDGVPSARMMLRGQDDSRPHMITMSAGAILGQDGKIEGITTLIQDGSVPTPPAERDDASNQHVEGLYRFSSLLAASADDVNRIARSMAALASEVIGDISAIVLLDPQTSRMRLVAFHDSEPASAERFEKLVPQSVEIAENNSLESAVLGSSAPVLLASLGAPDSLPSQMFGRFIDEMEVPSILMVPLIGRGGPIGAIALLRRHGGQAYTSQDRTFLIDVAGRAALAVENCLLFDSLQEEIAARLSAAQALDISEERFQSIFESTSLGIKILDLSGNILQTNAAFEKIIGYSEQEILGRRFYDFLHPADIARAVAVFQKLKQGGASSLRFQHRAIHQNGSTVWVNAIFSAVRTGGRESQLAFIVSILEDVTEQKQFEAEVAELKNQLQSTIELERLRLAHELHDGPMQDLYSVVYEIEELRGKAPTAVGGSLRSISDKIHRVLKDLRDTAKELRPPTISQFGLERTIRSYVGDMKESHPDLKVQLTLARDHQLLPEDVRLALFRVLQQAMTNIIRHAHASEARVRFSFDAEEARLEIWDNGTGFEVPSTWIDFVRQGHYGLAGAAERVNALGGLFAVESQPGTSTTVRAVVPWKEHLE